MLGHLSGVGWVRGWGGVGWDGCVGGGGGGVGRWVLVMLGEWVVDGCWF